VREHTGDQLGLAAVGRNRTAIKIKGNRFDEARATGAGVDPCRAENFTAEAQRALRR
jgi:hypothetical protein